MIQDKMFVSAESSISFKHARDRYAACRTKDSDYTQNIAAVKVVVMVIHENNWYREGYAKMEVEKFVLLFAPSQLPKSM